MLGRWSPKVCRKTPAWSSGSPTTRPRSACAWSEGELLSVYDTAHCAGLLTALINDLGRTEFRGAITKTCIAVGPDTPARLAPVTGRLKPL